MKRSTFLLPLLCLLIFIIACNNDPAEIKGDPPEKVLKTFFEKMSQKDFDGAAILATKDSKPAIDMLKQFVAMAVVTNPGAVAANDPAEKFKSVEIGKATVNGVNAIVPMKYATDSIEVEFPLKVEDGSWKTEFSVATLMKIGMAQMGKRGVPADSIAGKMQHLKEMMGKRRHLTDSLAKKLSQEKSKEQ